MSRGAFRASPRFIAFDGQSLNLLPVGYRYPTRLMQTHFPTIPYENAKIAIGSVSWTDLAKSASTRLHQYANSGLYSVLIGCGGQSDLTDENDSGATLYANEVAYAQAARAAGFDYIIWTTIVPSTTYTVAQNTARLDHNTLLLADASAAFDAKVDLANVTGLNNASGTDYSDGLHWSNAGVDKVVTAMSPAVAAIPGFPPAV